MDVLLWRKPGKGAVYYGRKREMNENREKTKDSTRTDNQPCLSSNAIKEYRQAVPTLDRLHRCT